MNDFMNYSCNVTKISTALYIPAGGGKQNHYCNRPYHCLALHMLGNKSYVFSDGKTLNIKSGDIIYLPKYSSYKVFSDLSGDCYAINFDLNEDVAFAPFTIHVKNQKEILENYKHATKVWQLKTTGYVEKCKAELYNIIYTLLNEYNSEYIPSLKYDIIKKGVEYMHHNYLAKNICIEELSSLCNVTPEYFRKIFKNFYGISPKKYIINLKIQHVKELIDSSMYSISEAAFQSGYTDMSHFSREFKKVAGLSPNDYKKAKYR